jgi:integrase
MSTELKAAVARYVRTGSLARGTRDEYNATLRKWEMWGGGVPIEQLNRADIRAFLDWVYERAVSQGGTNPGRTTNKARQNLRAVMGWAWERDIIVSLPRFPKPRHQREVAGRYFLSKSEINALYFATYSMKRPRGWDMPFSVGRYWRCALVLFFNYGLDTGTVWKSASFHQPILWRHVFWDQESPDRQVQQQSRWGWIFYRRVKTGKTFYRPMNHVVHAHIKSIVPEIGDPDDPIAAGGGSRPNSRFEYLCKLANLKPKTNIETGEEKPWTLKDLRKTCATYYDEHVPESSIEILGHSVGGMTYRHYAHRSPLAFRAITTIPQPSAFMSLIRGYEDECPCCRKKFTDG